MKPPKIIKISIVYLPGISKDSYEIRVDNTNFDKKRLHIVVQVQQKNYDLDNDSIIVKLQIKPVNSNPLQDQLQGIDSLRVKAFIYDFVSNDVIVAKLQEFEIDPISLKYSPSDDMLNTAPVILAWDNRNLIAKIKKEKKTNLLNEIKTIEIISELDDGSANDGTGSETQKGMIYGNKYTFKISGFTKEEPRRIDYIKWKIKYHNLTTMKWEEYPLNVNADKVTITFSTLEMCGRFLFIQAYMYDEKKPAELKLWMHNRFRWFDRAILREELIRRKNHIELPNQKNTPLCGIASIMYILMKKDFDLYNSFILEIHRRGYFELNNYIIDVNRSLHLLEVNPVTNKKFPNDKKGIMPYSDWIPFSCIRNQENDMFEYDGLEDYEVEGATLPYEIVSLMKELLKYKNVTDYTNFFTTKGYLFWDGEFSTTRELGKMEDLFNKGFEIIMLVNTNMLKNKVSETTDPPEHLIVYEGFKNKTIDFESFEFNVFSWGELISLKLNPDTFRTNFYGYIYGK